MSSPVRMFVIYKTDASDKFDMGYYVTKHMDLVKEQWVAAGMTKWEVVKFGPGLDGKDGPYSVTFIAEWGSREQIEKAAATEGFKALGRDVSNYTTITPEVWIGDIVPLP